MRFLLSAAALGLFLSVPAQAQRFVYTMTNQADSNEMALFARTGFMDFVQVGEIPTGGTGTGGSLGSQNPFVFSEDERFLIVTNPGSDDVSVMRLLVGAIPVPVSLTASQGDQPVSVAVRGDLVYVLNQASPANVAGFQMTSSGQLVPIPGAVFALSSPDANPAQVQFDPTGQTLIVSERSTARMAVFPVMPSGMLDTPNFIDTANDVPFGFEFADERLVLSEASPMPADTSSVSSFLLDALSATLTPVTNALPTNQDQACWIDITQDGRYAYAANTPSESISGFRIESDGSLVALTQDTIVGSLTGLGGARDIYIEGRLLFGILTNTGRVAAFQIQAGGFLSDPVVFGELPVGAAGMLAR